MHVYDERTTGMHWQRQKQGAEHYREQMRREASPEGAGISRLAAALT